MRDRRAIAIVAAIWFAPQLPSLIAAGSVARVLGAAAGALLVGFILVRVWQWFRGGGE